MALPTPPQTQFTARNGHFQREPTEEPLFLPCSQLTQEQLEVIRSTGLGIEDMTMDELTDMLEGEGEEVEVVPTQRRTQPLPASPTLVKVESSDVKMEEVNMETFIPCSQLTQQQLEIIRSAGLGIENMNAKEFEEMMEGEGEEVCVPPPTQIPAAPAPIAAPRPVTRRPSVISVISISSDEDDEDELSMSRAPPRSSSVISISSESSDWSEMDGEELEEILSYKYRVHRTPEPEPEIEPDVKPAPLPLTTSRRANTTTSSSFKTPKVEPIATPQPAPPKTTVKAEPPPTAKHKSLLKVKTEDPLFEFFSQPSISNSGFQYDPSQPSTSEYYRLLDHKKRLQGRTGKRLDETEHRKIKKEFQTALVRQFNTSYGTEVNDLESWQILCEVVGIEPIPETLEEAISAFDTVHVNLVDLVDTVRTGSPITVFDTVKELSDYTVRRGKFFPRHHAESGTLLVYLLRHIINPERDTRPASGRGTRHLGRRKAREDWKGFAC